MNFFFQVTHIYPVFSTPRKKGGYLIW